jgi:hypothetical protein
VNKTRADVLRDAAAETQAELPRLPAIEFGGGWERGVQLLRTPDGECPLVEAYGVPGEPTSRCNRRGSRVYD